MANSKYEYVKKFERENYLLPDTYVVIRVDGKGFHKFSKFYNFDKPNDLKALEVMNTAAYNLMNQFGDIVMAYGDSDEYSFLLKRSSEVYQRREAKWVSLFASSFTAYYLMEFSKQFDLQSKMVPIFDARAVVYPNPQVVQDYFRWRQVDCHINNLYNTTFWKLVESGMTNQEAENRLIGTLSADKNELLFKMGINYNNEPEIFKKGTIFVREPREDKKRKQVVNKYHIDLIKDDFWHSREGLLQ
ncbi:tRNA-His guanylyltransferase [Yamadazyma tenuis]|uniref:tRNA(His) guanylyltransferase n=1 Tax=Candida tenuis (strain ATCC 10573 / BCRC 21748 / CBS 615 / JCM 9827 / NBRC 10315 / NRRL Y-1498 / VKM Y-70) TaxID=590646 RepID=G3B1A5_CANTC|nr:GJ16007 [Yamadazyma tenuis ATCC 10573]EGV64923.1 GJ16007 [Yamadazyma tenuis ATCC 10573]WEJ97718.1 tRNA-His guanylyltransferase [Yamadazyma tenuis]